MTDEVLRGLIEVHATVGAAEACQLAEAVLSARASLARKDAFRDRVAAELERALTRNTELEAALSASRRHASEAECEVCCRDIDALLSVGVPLGRGVRG
jgi:hypothetical protein